MFVTQTSTSHQEFREMRPCVAESAVFVAVMSNNYCKYYMYSCQLEIFEARTTRKPTILIFLEPVDDDKMDVVMTDIFKNNARAIAWLSDVHCTHHGSICVKL